MTVISIRLPERLLTEVDHHAQACHIPRTEYIRQAIEHMNHEIKNKERRKQLIKASLRVRRDSMRINKEFSKIENDTKD